MRHLCKDPAYFLMCDFIFDQTGDKSISYDDLINNALFRMTPECAATLLVLLSLGCFSQWFIHSSNRVKNKAWAIVCSALFYFALLLCVVVVIMVFGQMTKGELYFQWVYNIGTMIVILGKIDFSLSYSFVLTHYFFSFFFLRHYFFLLRRHDISNILIVLDTRVWSVLWIFHPSDCWHQQCHKDRKQRCVYCGKHLSELNLYTKHNHACLVRAYHDIWGKYSLRCYHFFFWN